MLIKGGKFLITGGASMIGAHITEHLLEAGAREIVLLTTTRSARRKASATCCGTRR